MRKLLLLAILLFASRAYPVDSASIQPDDNWRTVKNAFLFSAEFECRKGEEIISKVIRTGFARYYYNLYDASDELKATGITRALSWGAFLPWAAEIDVWDGDFYIGKIEGEFSGAFNPKFAFYDSLGNMAVVAYMSPETYAFIIASAQDEAKSIGELKLLVDECGEWGWDMSLSGPLPQVDPRILKIFAAFVTDSITPH